VVKAFVLAGMGTEARVKNHERLCSNLETQVKNCRTINSFYHPTLRELRGTLKEAYASFLLEHYEAAQVICIFLLHGDVCETLISLVH
jgi:hypothetical protein